MQRSPRKGAAPLRNEVQVEVLNALRASILGAHLNGEISPASLPKECGHTVVRLGCFLGCEGDYGGSPSAPTNCGFVTFQQCLDTISGIGGFCVGIICISLRPDHTLILGNNGAIRIERQPTYDLRKSSGNFAMLAAIRRASLFGPILLRLASV